MASYRGRRRAPARPRLVKDQQEVDYGSIEIITADDFKESAVAELTPPGAQDTIQSSTDAYKRTTTAYTKTASAYSKAPTAYDTLMPTALPVAQDGRPVEKAALQSDGQPQIQQANAYVRTPTAEIRLAPVARKQTPVPPQQNFAPVRNAPVLKQAAPQIPIAKPITATNIDDTEITKIHARTLPKQAVQAKTQPVKTMQAQETARTDSNDDYGIEEVVDVSDVVLDVPAAKAPSISPMQPVFDRRHSDADGDECSAVSIPKLDQLDHIDQRQIETEELPVVTFEQQKKRTSVLFVPLVLVLGICLGYVAGTWQNYTPFYTALYTTLMQDYFPANSAVLSDDDVGASAPSVDEV